MDEVKIERVPSRKERRLENRKRKLKAFLELVQNSEDGPAENPKAKKKLKTEKAHSKACNGVEKKNTKTKEASKKKGDKKKKKTKKSVLSKTVKKAGDKKLKLKKKKSSKSTKKKMALCADEVEKQCSDDESPEPLEVEKPAVIGELNGEESPESPKTGKSLDECNYSELKALKRKAAEKKLPCPRIELGEAGVRSLITSENGNRNPLSMRDLQTLLLHLLMPGLFPISSRWGRVVNARTKSHVVTVFIEGIGIEDLKKNTKCDSEEKLEESGEVPHANNASDIDINRNGFGTQMQNNKVPLPSWLSSALPRTSSIVPLTSELVCNSSKPWEELLYMTDSSALWNLAMKGGNQECNQAPSHSESFNNQNNNNEHKEDSVTLPQSDRFDRRSLLLSPSDLYFFRYPLPNNTELQESGFKFSKEKYEKVTATSPMFGVDCEMCLTTENLLELSSISIVNENLELIYHKLVKPPNMIVNYMTRFSGLTEDMLTDVKTTLEDVHRDLNNLLPSDAILVGHSLNSDLKALKLMHPYVIDTAAAYNLSYIRQKPPGLQMLAKMFLEKEIQMNPGGHDPTEDAIATLELVQLKLKNDIAFGNVLEGFRIHNYKMIKKSKRMSLPMQGQEAEDLPEDYFNLFQHTSGNKVNTALLMTPNTADNFKDILESVPKDKVDVHILAGNKEISEKGASVSINKDFAYLHMKVTGLKDCKSTESRKHLITKLDKRLNRIYKGACQRSLVMYIFTGSAVDESEEKYSNGLFMCCVKEL